MALISDRNSASFLIAVCSWLSTSLITHALTYEYLLLAQTTAIHMRSCLMLPTAHAANRYIQAAGQTVTRAQQASSRLSVPNDSAEVWRWTKCTNISVLPCRCPAVALSHLRRKTGEQQGVQPLPRHASRLSFPRHASLTLRSICPTRSRHRPVIAAARCRLGCKACTRLARSQCLLQCAARAAKPSEPSAARTPRIMKAPVRFECCAMSFRAALQMLRAAVAATGLALRDS